MAKKVVIVVASVLIVALVVGAVFVIKNDNKDTSTKSEETVTIQSSFSTSDEKETFSTMINESTETVNKIQQQIVSKNLSVIKCIDTYDDKEITPREVLGEDYLNSYIEFDTDNNFRMNLGYNAKSGTYKIDYDKNEIRVIYNDDTESIYRVILDDQQNIEYIIVPYGEFEVYFG